MPKKTNYFVAIYATSTKLLKKEFKLVINDITAMLAKGGLLKN